MILAFIVKYMRTLSQIVLFVGLIGTFWNPVSAASPFESLFRYLPDIAVTDIHQETRFVYARVCNLGGVLSDSETTLVVGIQKPGGGIVSAVESAVLVMDNCHEFQVASLDELGIIRSGRYNLSAGVLLKGGRTENNLSNNKITRVVDIVYPSKNLPATISYPTYSYQSNSVVPYCTASNNYCNNNLYYNNSNFYYRNNICPSWDVACNNSYYDSINNTATRYCTSSNNYCNNYDPYYNSNSNYYSNNGTYCNYSNNYCNNYPYYNNTPQYGTPDLFVQKISQNSGDKHIVAQICNQGGDMNGSVSLRTSFSSNNSTSYMYNTLQIGRGQCTSTVVYTTPAELGIFYSGNYSISITTDVNNNVSEQNESNNTLSQYLFLETNQNQRPDLVVDRISTNDNNRTIITRVCNIGDDMVDYNNWVMEISNTTNNSTLRNSGYRLSRGQCTEVATSYASLGVYNSGGYTFRVILDPDNALSEQSRYNNTLSQYLQVWMNY